MRFVGRTLVRTSNGKRIAFQSNRDATSAAGPRGPIRGYDVYTMTVDGGDLCGGRSAMVVPTATQMDMRGCAYCQKYGFAVIRPALRDYEWPWKVGGDTHCATRFHGITRNCVRGTKQIESDS